jgi:hypothetical protein
MAYSTQDTWDTPGLKRKETRYNAGNETYIKIIFEFYFFPMVITNDTQPCPEFMHLAECMVH